MLKSSGIGSKQVDNFSRSGVTQQSLVRCEKALPLLEVLEIGIVECLRCGWVHVYCNSWIYISRTQVFESICVFQVQCWIYSAFAFEIVYPFGESAAVGESNRMCSYTQINCVSLIRIIASQIWGKILNSDIWQCFSILYKENLTWVSHEIPSALTEFFLIY